MVHQDSGTPQETEPDLTLSVWVSSTEARVSSGWPRGWGLWLQQSWETWCVSPTIEPRGRQPTNWRTNIPKKLPHCYKNSRAHNRFPNLGIQQRNWEDPGNLTLKASRIWLQRCHRTGKQTLGKQNLVRTRTQEKGAVTPQETEPDLPVSIQESLAEARVDNSGLPWGQGHWIQQSVLAQALLKEATIIAITPTRVGPQAKL